MTEWVLALAELTAAGRPAVVVTVLRAEGSTPRDPGAKMVVWDGGFQGSVGGGHLELEALKAARELLAAAARGGPGAPAGPVLRELALGPGLGQCCGGMTTLLFEAIVPVAWDVAVFGAGHVGRALVRVLGDLPCRIAWIDSREDQLPKELPPRARRIVADPPEDEVDDLPPGTDVVVMTHSHQVDLQIVEAALRRTDLGYLGVIGSRTKRARFMARLSERGFTPEALARLTCPIGVLGAHGKLPAEIAVAVAAQLLQARGARTAAEAVPPRHDAEGGAP